ncbi:NADPH-dependent FMN reductase [Streptomyces rubellomurinus]|uniref:NADPH-dependent FMN reductase n=2 Tax=Streptomyces TaxID=1883 RepID=A0A0F2TEA8_STRR3|nr:NADPH-dependent FMN reductase [Streptomyces rubellomurinus]KJS53880.1 NADPH-dependent FMN reductase [Streptomyces rubellomurinus subsp. indigoferus]KJS60102.1 NADPH-dependent FMN reductase [Streptomyces rubellomurinus]
MPSILVISGSPSPASRTERIGDIAARWLTDEGCRTEHLRVRSLPAGPLLSADVSHPAIALAAGQVARADGVVLATPTYKASFSGLLKSFLDLLPQFGLDGKAVLPLATGGSLAHVLVLDYALRPVLHSLGARHVVQGHFVLDQHVELKDGRPWIRPESRAGLDAVLEQFRAALPAGRSVTGAVH